MLRYLADEHVPKALVRGIRLREPRIVIVRNQDVGLRTTDDESVLDWAALNGYVVLTEDRNTMTGFANDRIAAGNPFAGLVVYRLSTSVAVLIEDTLTVAEVYTPDEIATMVVFLPL